jgi:hypothetical protein
MGRLTFCTTRSNGSTRTKFSFSTRVWSRSGRRASPRAACVRQAAQETAKDLSAKGITRRHWLGMLDLDSRRDGSLFVRSYAQLWRLPGAARRRCVCEDLLRHDGEQWLVRNRQVWRDDLR